MKTMPQWMRRAVGAVAAAAAFAAPALAEELTMYYPVAVGGPVTKIIDRLSEKANLGNQAQRYGTQA